jgi:hypothetical protein
MFSRTTTIKTIHPTVIPIITILLPAAAPAAPVPHHPEAARQRQ